MTGAALAFTAGVLLLQQQAALPQAPWLVLIPVCAALAAWRRLLLVTKAKLEYIADGASTTEREFFSDILLPDGQTVHQAMAQQIEESYRTGNMPKLLPGFGET